MAELDILPAWAINYLRENLIDHTHIINALPIDKGRMRGGYLINTSEGGVVMVKPRGGEPVHWFLPFPARHYTFTCDMCSERIEFVDPDVPRTVYCTYCGARYALLLEGGQIALRREGGRPTAPESQVVAFGAKSKPAIAAAETVPAADAPFTHNGYTLYARPTRTRGGGETTFYFFAKNAPGSGTPSTKPAAYDVGVNERTGLPYLRRHDKAAAEPGSQCAAITSDGKQCRRTATAAGKYCHLHRNHKPVSRDEALSRLDSKPRSKLADDTKPTEGDRGAHSLQCAAVTADGAQCSNRSRAGSKYCGIHKAYRPAKGARVTDTKPVGHKVKDTKPSLRPTKR